MEISRGLKCFSECIFSIRDGDLGCRQKIDEKVNKDEAQPQKHLIQRI
jgi:hypothetical protein